jgi:hypothetical protein
MMRFVCANFLVFFATPMLAMTCRELMVGAMAAPSQIFFGGACQEFSRLARLGVGQLLFLEWWQLWFTGAECGEDRRQRRQDLSAHTFCRVQHRSVHHVARIALHTRPVTVIVNLRIVVVQSVARTAQPSSVYSVCFLHPLAARCTLHAARHRTHQTPPRLDRISRFPCSTIIPPETANT